MIHISLYAKQDRLAKLHDALEHVVRKFGLGGLLTLQEAKAQQGHSLVLNMSDSLQHTASTFSLGQWVVQTQRIRSDTHPDSTSVIEVTVFATYDNKTFYRLSTEYHPEGGKSRKKNDAVHEKRVVNQIVHTLHKVAKGELFPFETHCVACYSVTLTPGLPGMSLMRCFARKMSRIKRNFFLERWHCGVLPVTLKKESDLKTIKHARPLWLPLCKNRQDFKADSFGMYRDGYYYFFYEYYNDELHKGEIRYEKIVIDKDGISTLGQGLALRLEEHLSYPFLFEYHGQTYMLPECHESGGVQLYRAVRFPDQWTHCKTLIPGFKGVDSSVFYYNGVWWIFCTSADADSNLRLFVWYANDLFGPWKEHRLNPVKVDIRSSRSGGTPFVLEGQLYRPAQNSSRTYGGGLVLNKVTELTTTTFKEIPVCDFSGFAPFEEGFHTFSLCHDVIFIDGKDHILKPKYLLPWRRGR
jgi:hypothetical protein